MLFTQQNKTNARIELTKSNTLKNIPNNLFKPLNPKPTNKPRLLKKTWMQNAVAEMKPVEHRDEMTWGRATWFLFHSLAEKVKEERFLEIKKELCNNIYRICNSLPCEICRKHALEYIKNINFDNIKTKTDFKKMLFNFHNVVNKNKNYHIFKYEDLDEKYAKSNLNKIINNFFNYMSVSRNKTSPANDMQNNMILQGFKSWISNNRAYFDI
jgi:hypothetical protein